MLVSMCVIFARTQSAALRPMCGDIVQNSHDRAQILALWTAAGRLGRPKMEYLCLFTIILVHFGIL